MHKRFVLQESDNKRAITNYLASRQRMVDGALQAYLPKPSIKPKTIHKAMRYSVFAGGKRLRPILCLAAAECCGGELSAALPLACAVECVHTYSLIHDDLPCMDDDDLRRGMPTSHKVFGEAIAVLAGDALLTFAFELAAQVPAWPRYSLNDIIRELAIASGSRNLIAGQVADLEGEGKRVSLPALRFIHQSKTAALLRTSIRLGAMSANAAPARLQTLSEFGMSLGLAFQVIDDILDVTQSSETLGKSAGKDLVSEKATYPSVIGLDQSRKVAKRLTEEAHRSLNPFVSKAGILHQLADYLLDREY
ncbi:MAG: polyprenyl synthetase family protein [Verrucomicrobia bacterium]|nr:polyprenyl synthetase family protein [Verrucomicrobiota bacterium]MBV8375900.1 polyprenyl synthetase family protein [Verrucomicrobiota bacterium]